MRSLLRVDAAAVRANVARLRAAHGGDVWAVVKADGYGHGAADVGRAALEAGAIGLPVVAADVGGVREVVVPRETGLLYESGDVDALVRALRVVLEDPSRAASMGVAGRERVAQLFDVKGWVDETEALFARLVEGK